MQTKKVQRIGHFWLATSQRTDGQWVAWAQTTPIYSDLPLSESGERVWTASGHSREQAAARLKRQLALPPYDPASIQERQNCWLMLLAGTVMTLGGVVATEPIFILGGIVGIIHGSYACVWLSEAEADSRRT
jgi:hypothetical protein